MGLVTALLTPPLLRYSLRRAGYKFMAE
jgi:hypothetical protein